MAAYTGPTIVLSHEEGAALLNSETTTPAALTARAKITAALDSDPCWKRPL